MDFIGCFTSTISWVLASLIYDEEKFIGNVDALFPRFNTHLWAHKHGSHVHAVVLDDLEGRAWHVHRGTDGFDSIGVAISWFNDMCIVAGNDGTHNGFDRLAHRAFDESKRYLENYNFLYEAAHSQGSGVGPLDAALCVENLTLKHVQCDLFATPPCIKKEALPRFEKHIKSGKLSGNQYTMPGDPIASEKLRNEHSWLLDGVDIFEPVILPDLIAPKIKPLELINHSCRIYNAGYLQHIINITRDVPIVDVKLLAMINDWIVN